MLAHEIIVPSRYKENNDRSLYLRCISMLSAKIKEEYIFMVQGT